MIRTQKLNWSGIELSVLQKPTHNMRFEWENIYFLSVARNVCEIFLLYLLFLLVFWVVGRVSAEAAELMGFSWFWASAGSWQNPWRRQLPAIPALWVHRLCRSHFLRTQIVVSDFDFVASWQNKCSVSLVVLSLSNFLYYITYLFVFLLVQLNVMCCV